jgi:PAS domain S-box-containing protein
MSIHAEKNNIHPQAVEAFKHSDQLFHALLEKSSDMVALLTNQGCFVYGNPAMQKLVGYTPEELYSQSSFERIPIEQREDIAVQFAALVHMPEASITLEHSYVHRNGSIRWVESTFTNLLDNPDVQAVLLNAHDITTRKQVEKERQGLLAYEQAARAEEEKNNEKQLHLITDSLPALVAYIDTNECYQFANKSYEVLFGRTKEALVGLTLRELLGDVVYCRAAPIIEQSLAGHIVSYEASLPDLSGGERAFQCENIPDIDEQGAVRGFVALALDITERKQIETSLRESEEFARSLLHSSPDCLKVLDLQGNLLMMNEGGQCLMEIDDFSQVEGKWWPTFWQGENRLAVLEALSAAVGGGIGHFQGPAPTAKGTPKWWDVLVAPVFDTQGIPLRLVSVSRDITLLKELERQKDDFISMASHELKTPVTSMKGFVSLLARHATKQGDEKAQHYLTRIDNQLNRLTRLVSDLLDISKMQSGKLTYQEELVDLTLLVKETIENVQETTNTHQIVLENAEQVMVSGDRDRLGQVLINLITNAIKYSPQANRVIVHISADTHNAIVSIQDFGIGIADVHHQKVFDQFYQVTGVEGKTYPGLGIGLYIAQEIVKRHHGRIHVESVKDAGSTFYFTLPLHPKK